MSDRILLSGLTFFGRHGVLPAEQALGGRFVVDVEASLDLRAAGERDDLAATVDYSQLYARVRDIVEGPPCKLVEALAERLAAALLADFPLLEAVTVRVHKPGAPIPGAASGQVAVEVTRWRDDAALPAPGEAGLRPTPLHPNPTRLPRVTRPRPDAPPEGGP